MEGFNSDEYSGGFSSDDYLSMFRQGALRVFGPLDVSEETGMGMEAAASHIETWVKLGYIRMGSTGKYFFTIAGGRRAMEVRKEAAEKCRVRPSGHILHPECFEGAGETAYHVTIHSTQADIPNFGLMDEDYE